MAEEKKKVGKPTCYTCHAEVIFDKNILSPRGIQIPLDPTTKKPHECQKVKQEETETEKEKEKQTELSKQNEQKIKAVETHQGFPISEKTEQPIKVPYVDHTLARPSEVKILRAYDTEKLELEYQQFQIGKKFAWTRAQYQPVTTLKGTEYTIAFYYELAK